MDIAIFINTPSQAHFYKNIIRKLEADGNRIVLLARDYGETIDVLDGLKMNYHIYSHPSASKSGKILTLPIYILNAYRYLRTLNVDIVIGFGIIEAYTSLLLKVPSIIFNDTEPTLDTKSYGLQFKLFMPLINAIITPISFRQDLGKKHIKVNSFKEMAYLHPNYYKPNRNTLILQDINYEHYILLRFSAYDAVHDANIKGLTNEDKIALVNELKKYADVLISSEAPLPEEIKDYALRIPKSKIHDIMYYADLLITETGTMATEGAILGTPVVRFFSGAKDVGNLIDLEKKYGLIFTFNDPKLVLKKAVELISDTTLKQKWLIKKNKLLQEKSDIAEFIVRFIEGYPCGLNNSELCS